MSSLLRSTKFVRYFTGAARTILLNTAKTAETNLLINSKALCAANNVLMRDYATKKAESLEPLLLKLDTEVRRYGRIAKKDIDDVFDEIRSRNDITSSQSLLVIRCCGELVPEELPEQRTLLVQKIWSVLTERGIPMDISHYNALLRVYLENEHPFSPAHFLEELDKKGLQPNRVTYQRLMWRYCQEGDVEGATKVLEKMRELKFPVSEPVLNALVMGHAFHGDTDGAKAVIETMARAGLQPTNRTYTLLACGFARKGDVDGVNDVINQATEKDAILIDKDVLEIIEHLAISGHGDKVEQLLPQLKKNVGYNQEVCNLILKLLNKNQVDVAKKMLTTMPKTNQQDDTAFKGAFFIKQLVRVGKSSDEVLKTCLELKSEDLIPNSIYMATEQSLIQGRTELAEKLFTELEKEGHEIRPHYYWPLLAQKVKENDEEGLLQLVKNMNQKNFNISGEALRDYVIPYLIKKDPKSIVTKLQLANVPVAHTARNLIVETLDQGNIAEAADIALKYKTRGSFGLIKSPLLNALAKTKDIKSFVTILHVLNSKQLNQTEEDDDGQQQEADLNDTSRIVTTAVKIVSSDDLTLNLLTLLHDKGLKISTQAAENIEQYLGENMTTQISELLSQLTSTELEIAPLESPKRDRDTPRNSVELEKLISLLKTKEGTNVNRLQKQLLTTYIKENNVEKVNSYIEELKSSGFEITLITYAQLFEFYCENDMIDKANECQAKISAEDPDFVLNQFKIISMVTALVKANKFDEAIQYLKASKGSIEVESNFIYNSKCWQLLNTIVEQKDPAKVKQMANTLIELDFIKPSNVLLGPLIKVHMINNDLEGALNEFEYCCNQYRTTPWKGELMKALIMKEDAAKLQWLADLSTQIHGEVNILHDLVLSFVECGRLRQARRILGTPGLQARHRRLEEACLRYVEEGKSEYLEGLLEATKELSNIDRSNIFYHLLVAYCKANETDKALGLWTLLQEEGEVPSDQFLAYLGNHLKEKRQPVPFVIPNLNQVEPKPKTTIERRFPLVKEKVQLQKPVTNNQESISSEIEKLIQDGQLLTASEKAIKSINNGFTPKANVVKYLLKTLALEGNVESIENIGKLIDENKKKKVAFNDNLTLAIFTKGGAEKHIDELVKSTDAITSNDEMENVMRNFPRGQALASIMNNEELYAKCLSVAEKAASKGQTNAVNLLWMELILSGKSEKADELFQKYLMNSTIIIFRKLLQESHVRKQPELIETLIENLKKNKQISLNSVGNAYSRLIGYYISENQVEKAEQTLEKAFSSGLGYEHINNSCLYKLKSEVEKLGKDFKYELK